MVGASSAASPSSAAASSSPAPSAFPSASSLAALAAASSYYASCMQGWHYRCLGLDPSAAVSAPGPIREACASAALLRGGDMAIRSLAHQKSSAAAAAAAGGGGRKAGSGGAGGNRILVTVSVLGSAGPIRFVTSEGEPVAAVIGTALRSYAREGRLPVLGSDYNGFLLFCAHSNYMDALNPSEPIGANGGRNFVLCKKQLPQVALTVPDRVVAGGSPVLTVQPHSQSAVEKKGGNGGSWKAWLNKSFSFKISSH